MRPYSRPKVSNFNTYRRPSCLQNHTVPSGTYLYIAHMVVCIPPDSSPAINSSSRQRPIGLVGIMRFPWRVFQSRNPDQKFRSILNLDIYFRRPTFRACFQSRISPRFSFKIPSLITGKSRIPKNLFGPSIIGLNPVNPATWLTFFKNDQSGWRNDESATSFGFTLSAQSICFGSRGPVRLRYVAKCTDRETAYMGYRQLWAHLFLNGILKF